jgi:hypothetical protein
MAFIARAPSEGPGIAPFSIEKKTRAQAIRAAVALVARGIEGVTITDEDGKIYSPANFRAFFNKGRITGA